jgi:hypothetical protein
VSFCSGVLEFLPFVTQVLLKRVFTDHVAKCILLKQLIIDGKLQKRIKLAALAMYVIGLLYY